ncbi:MAG TPA: hypothetical protein VE571_11215, partial [Solirubrobacteraceae bacterium]|nr:hypothetical protein [Solirubrobacteraceae bacterium]
MTVSQRRLAGLAVTACCAVSATGALAAAASAATLTPDKACYVITDTNAGAPMTITGAGFTPGSTVQLTGGSPATFVNAAADGAGNVSFTAKAPELGTGPGSKRTTFTATDPNGVSAAVTVRSANLSVATKPGSVRNVHKDKVTFSFSGFVPGKRIYGYYIRKKIVAKAKFGKAQGPCGVLKQKA